MQRIFIFIIALLILHSCERNQNEPEDLGIPTTVSGNVYDYVNQKNVPNYKIKFIKSWRSCQNWMCGWASETIGETVTDGNGSYRINFNYKLNPGESYGFEEKYYGTPYYPEYEIWPELKAGQNNVRNIKVWKPLNLTVHLKFTNNKLPPLTVGNKLVSANSYLFNTEFNYEESGDKVLRFRTKPNSDITVDFWYNENYNSSNPKRHLYSIPVTTLNNDLTISAVIDCSKF